MIFLWMEPIRRKFIPKYSDIAKPLTELTKFDVAFKWSDECQRAYDLLKEYLLKEPILRYPDPMLPYILYTDASKYAWAGVLTQSYTYFIEEKEREVHHPITYLSGLFKGSQMNWATLTKDTGRIQMRVLTTLPSFFLIFLFPLYIIRKSKLCNRWRINTSIP